MNHYKNKDLSPPDAFQRRWRKAPHLFWLAALLCSALSLEAASVKDFGAVGDGRSDDTTAFKEAIEYAGRSGEALHIPAGRYLIRDDISIERAVDFVGSGHQKSIITSNGRSARLGIRASGTTFRDIGFEDMVEPIVLGSRSGYVLENLRFERCRFEDMQVTSSNRGVIGLNSGNSSERPHPIRKLVIKECVFRNINAHAVNIRANIREVHVLDSHFEDLINDRGDDGYPGLGGFAIRLGESSDDADMLDEFAEQGHHLIEGNTIRNMRKNTQRGNLIGMLLYGNRTIIRNNLIENIDGTDEGNDTNAMYIRGAYNEVLSNTIRNVRGADDDGALCFKGGLDLGSRHNIVSHNLIENITGMSAVEASTSFLRFFENEIVNASKRGFQQRSGEGLFLTNNIFREADTEIRTQWGEVLISGNAYFNCRISIGNRRGHPLDREAVHIENNLFRRTAGSKIPMIRFANNVEEEAFVSIRNNRFENLIDARDDGSLVDLVANTEGTPREIEIIDNHIVLVNHLDRNGFVGTIFRVSSQNTTVSGSTFGTTPYGRGAYGKSSSRGNENAVNQSDQRL